MTFDIEMIKKVYSKLPGKIATARKELGKPLTLTEKILYSHINSPFAPGPEWLSGEDIIRGKTYVDFYPDRVAMQDATAQMALLQFMQAGRKKTAVPSTVHCDHLITAKSGAKEDLDFKR